MKKSKMLVCRVGIVCLGLLAAVVFAVDTDTDGMSDGYELFFGLNHTNAADALLDTDGDSLTNLTESILWTDPLFADTDRDGWADSIDANPLSRAVFLWSNPKFATGDSYLYTGPAWWNHAFRVGGDWTTNGWEAGNGLSNNAGSLNIQVLRSLLTNDVVLDVELFDSTNASLYAALCDSNQAVIVSDLYGNIVTGSQEVVTRRLSIPFSSYSNASILRLWRGTGDITVYSSLMYIDEDGDGVDADQELQAGTSDDDSDSDDDGLNDFAELFLTDTDPLDADSDDDGYDDQAEVIAESDPNDDQSLPPYAVCFTLPFTETFEERSAGDLDGQHGWEVNDGGVATVQSNIVFNGEQALSVTDASVSHEFTDAQTNVWVSYRLKAVPGSEPQDLPADMAVVFYVNADSFLCAYSNQMPITLPVKVSNDWNRFDIHSDFSSKHWNMRFNRELVVDNFPFYGSPDAFSILRVDGNGTYMDDVQVVFENPDRDNDGYTNDEEAEGGSNPDDANSIPVSEVAVSGVVIYDGSQTGTVRVIATTVSNGWNSAPNDQLSAPGAYSITNVPVLSNVWIKAWLDSDENGVCDPWDAKGAIESPLCLSWAKGGVDLALNDPADSDSDGLPDWRELELGTNPDEQDTDGDGLSDYTEVHSAYRVVWMSAKWNEAKLDAERRGGHLAVITSEQEHDDMVEALGEEPFNQSLLWIGASDEAEEEVWEWVTGEAFDYARWANNAPNAGEDSQDGLAYKKGASHQWDDRSWRSGGYILEYENGIDPLNPDTDGDGVMDGDEVFLGINPVGADTDGDGVSDGNEISMGTDPLCIDSDSDGLSDGEEVSAGTDPLQVDTDGDGLSDKKELKDSRYQVVKKCLTWHEAKRDAELRGGHLATVTSEEEHVRILDAVGVQALREFKPWIGATDEAEEGVWTWVTGEVFDYVRWGAGRLDQTTGLQDWAYYLNTVWNDKKSKNPIPYLLEYEFALDPLNPDTDGDGISDGDELTLGTSPHRVDSDGDGFSDQEEINLGMNPSSDDSDSDGLADHEEAIYGTDILNPDMDGDGLLDGEEVKITLTDPLNADSDEDGVEDQTLILSINGVDATETHATHIAAVWNPLGDSLELTQAIAESYVCYTITNGAAGIYRLAVQASWAEGRPPFGFVPRLELFVDGHFVGVIDSVSGQSDLPEYVCYTPWLVAGSHEIKIIPMGRLKDYPDIDGGIIMDAIELYAIDGVDSDDDGIQDWVDAILAQGQDADGDGVSDRDEIALGTNLLNADTDGDGLTDSAELAAGTDPLDADSDDDGVLDGIEVNEVKTDALVAEFDGTVIDHLIVLGSATNRVTGSWEVDGTELRSTGRRGAIEYSLTLPGQDLYCLNINATHLWENSGCNPMLPVDTSHLQVYVDDLYVGSYPLVAADSVYKDIRVFLPVLPAGEHNVRIFWENTHKMLSLKVRELRLQEYGGPDADADGVKDWVQVSLAGCTSIDSPLQSVVSPICLEGAARFAKLARISNIEQGISNIEVKKGAGERWFVDMPLNEEGETEITVSFQNRALERSVLAEWVPFNILQESQINLMVRIGDSVKLTALPEGWNGGQFTLWLDGEEHRSPNCQPLVFAFDQPGTYVIDGEYRKGGQRTEKQFTVTVVDWAFPEEAPACIVGGERTWSLLDVPHGTVFDTDNFVSLLVEEVLLTTNNQQKTLFNLLATSVNGDHVIAARLYEDGPIVDTLRIDPFWVQNASEGYFWTVERFEDSELWEVNSIVKHLPDTVDMQIKVIIGGVTFDDYTLERWVTRADYDETGQYNFRLFHPNEISASVCHTFKLYQNGAFLGEAFSGVQDNLDVDQTVRPAALDTDGDGVSDRDEIALGTNLLNADTDGDGLDDGAELTAGTDPLNADSDDDGVSDGVEVNEVKTDALVAEFDGTVIDHLIVLGSATNRVTGSWEVDGTELRSTGRRGALEYLLTLPEQDLYCLNINATHLWENSGCTPITPIDTSHLQVYVDNLYVGSYPLVAADSVYKDIRVFLPVLPAGEHTVRIFWENTHKMLSLKVRELRLQEYGGPDADGDGVKDWVQASLAEMTSVDAGLESFVSPACIEGTARYPGLATLSSIANPQSSIVNRAAGERWFVDMPLNEEGETEITVSFQNRALERSVLAEWVPFNIMEYDGEELVIRAGDSLKLIAVPEEWSTGQFTLTLNGEELCVDQTLPLIHAFSEAGIYTLGAESQNFYALPQSGSVTIRVIDWSFPEESPACLVGRDRKWSFDKLPDGAVLETDSTVRIADVWMGTSTNSQEQTSVWLSASAVNGEHVAVVRLYSGGPVLDTIRLNPFWVQNATEGYFWVVERYEDSELWEVNSVVKNLPDTVDMQIKVIIGGVTLDDYTLERWITNEVYDETGQYNFRLLHPNEISASVCHTFKVYQNGVFIGEAFSGGQDEIVRK